MLFHVYLLFSESKNRYYIGYSSNLEARLIRHNQKSKGFTGNTNDWKVVYTEQYNTKEEAAQVQEARALPAQASKHLVLQRAVAEVLLQAKKRQEVPLQAAAALRIKEANKVKMI